jgi:hypothetical protein
MADDQTAELSPDRAAYLDKLSKMSEGAKPSGPPEPLDPYFRGEVGAPAPEKPSEEDQAARAAYLQKLAQMSQDERAAQPISPALQVGLRAAFGPLVGGFADAANAPIIGPMARNLMRGGADVPVTSYGGTGAVVSNMAHYFDVGATDDPRLVGMPLDQVRARRDALVQQQAEIQRQMDAVINSGTPETANLPELGIKNSQYQASIDELNGILASGKPKAGPSGQTNLLRQIGGAARRVAQAAPEVQEQIRQALPTTQQFDQSVAGQISSGIGTATVMSAAAFAGPVIDLGLQYLYASGTQYEDAKAKGASDNDAENAALLGGLASVPQALVLNSVAGRMGQKLAGKTPKQAITELAAASGLGAAGGATFQGYQNAVAALSGYDPNRPLDQGVYQQVLFGAGLGFLTSAVGVIPGYAKYARGARTEGGVREKPGAPPQTGAESGEAQPPPVPAAAAPPAAAPGPATAQATAELAARAQQQDPQQLITTEAARQDPLGQAQAILDEMFAPQPTAEGVRAGQAVTPEAPAAPIAPTRTAEPTPAAPYQKALTPGPAEEPRIATEPAQESKTPAVQTEEVRREEQARREITPAEVRAAYDEERKSTSGSAVMISKVGDRLGVSAPEIKAWMEDAAKRGEVTLDVGHWPTATDQERAAAVDFMGEKRLTVRYTEPEVRPVEQPVTPVAPHYASHEEELAATSGSLKEVQDKIREEFRLRKQDLSDKLSVGEFTQEQHDRLQAHADRQLDTSLQNGRIQWEQKQFRAQEEEQAASFAKELLARQARWDVQEVPGGFHAILDGQPLIGLLTDKPLVFDTRDEAAEAAEKASRGLYAGAKRPEEAARPAPTPKPSTYTSVDRPGQPAKYRVSGLDVSKPAHDLSAYHQSHYATKAAAQQKMRELKAAGVYQQIKLEPIGATAEVGKSEQKAGDLDQFDRAQRKVYGDLTPVERAAVDSGDPDSVAEYQRRVAAVNDAWSNPSRPPGDEAPAIRGEAVPPPLPEGFDVRPTQSRVKQEVNDAAAKMGLEQVVKYVPNAEALPERVKKTLTKGQRENTAQTVYDRSMHDLWVIGDRFDSHADLQRALIEETQGRIWGDRAQIQFKHDANDPRHGYYDIPADKVVLNTDALLNSADPYRNAYRTSIEEIAIHKGISYLYGSRESQAYVDAMNGLQRNFDRAKLNDVLAQEKGFRNLEEMAKRYGYEDYASNPRHQHALTEELAGAYAQRFATRDDIENSAPQWYQRALDMLSNGIRRRLGLQVPPLDMQHLLADSMSALRFPKYMQPGRFDPDLVAEAKIAMGEHQLASLRGTEGEEGGVPSRPSEGQLDFLRQLGMEHEQMREAVSDKVRQQNIERGLGAPQPPRYADVAGSAEAAAARTAAGVTQTANIGDLFVKDRLRETAAGLGPEKGIRAQPPKLAMQRWRSLLERMGYASPETAVYDIRGREIAAEEARATFKNQYNSNVHEAMADLRNPHSPTDVNPALRNLLTRRTDDQIKAYRDAGLEEAARRLETERDHFNQAMQERVTGTAQELEAQGQFTDGAQQIGKIRSQISRQQRQAFAGNKQVGATLGKLKQVTREAAQIMANRLSFKAEQAVRRAEQAAMKDPRTLADRYIRAVADSIDSNFAKAGFNAADRPMLQELFNNFQQRIKEQLDEDVKAGRVSLPEAKEGRPPPSPTMKIRDVLSNFEMFKRTFGEVVDTLKTRNPNAVFFANLDRALAEPFGERGVRNVIGESNKISDLIYNHYSTQERIGNDLARSLVENLGLPNEQALRAQERFDALYRNILETESKAKIESIVSQMQTAAGKVPMKGEIDRMLDLMAIGGFNRDEYLNVIGPRFGLRTWTPEILQGIKEAGDMLMQIRDDGNASPAIRNRYEAQIADLIAQTAPMLGWQGKAVKRGEAMYMASLLTGLISHTGYVLQNAIGKMLNLSIMAMRTGDVHSFNQGMLAAMQGFERSLRTDIPYIWQTGMAPERGILEPGGTIPFRSALESTPFERGPWRVFNNYKYVGRALLAIEQFSLRGTEYAMKSMLASRLADELGYHGQDADRFANQAVYGTEDKIAEANRLSLEDQKKYNLTELERRVRENEILDRLKDQSENPDTAIADKETEALQSISGQATRFGLHTALREDVAGGAGIFSRIIQQARLANPAISFIIPFNKLPMNLANEYMSWSPIGIWRGRDMFSGTPIGKMFRMEPGTTRGIESYYGTIPGFAERVAAGKEGRPGGISQRELRDMAYEQMIKGAVGTAAMAVVGSYVLSQKDNPDPPFWITGEGPTDARARDMMKAEGVYPYTVKIGSMRFSYENLGGLKGMLATIGGAADYARFHSHPDDPGAYYMAGLTSAAIAAAGSVTDSSPLQGLSAILSIAEGRNSDEKLRRAQDQVANWASTIGMIPLGGTFGRQMYRVIHPEQYEANDMSSTLMRNIPIVNTIFLRPKLNVLGENVINPPWIKIPLVGGLIEAATMHPDPVWDYISHTGLHLSLPGYSGKVDGVKMSPEELHVYHEAKGSSLKQQLSEAIGDQNFTSQSIEDQDKEVKNEFEKTANEEGARAVIAHRMEKGQ